MVTSLTLKEFKGMLSQPSVTKVEKVKYQLCYGYYFKTLDSPQYKTLCVSFVPSRKCFKNTSVNRRYRSRITSLLIFLHTRTYKVRYVEIFIFEMKIHRIMHLSITKASIGLLGCKRAMSSSFHKTWRL